MPLVCCFRDLGHFESVGLVPGSRFGLVSDKGCFVCVVTRSLVRLGLEDRARGVGASEARDTGKKAAPEYVVRLGLSVPYVCMHYYMNVINHVVTMGLRVPNICISCREMVLLRHGTCDYRPKGVGIIICALGRGSATGS